MTAKINTDAYLSKLQETYYEDTKITEVADPDMYVDAMRDEEAQEHE